MGSKATHNQIEANRAVKVDEAVTTNRQKSRSEKVPGISKSEVEELGHARGGE
jgi:hypothetical protein